MLKIILVIIKYVGNGLDKREKNHGATSDWIKSKRKGENVFKFDLKLLLVEQDLMWVEGQKKPSHLWFWGISDLGQSMELADQ